jgi:hypothetical protein
VDHPPRLNLIRLGNEWIVTNGKLAADGSIRFPEGELAEEVFVVNDVSPDPDPPGESGA